MQCTCSVLAVWAACRLHWLCSADCNYTAISLECNCSVQTCYHKRRPQCKRSAHCSIQCVRSVYTASTADTLHVLECVCSVHSRALQVHCSSIWVSSLGLSFILTERLILKFFSGLTFGPKGMMIQES